MSLLINNAAPSPASARSGRSTPSVVARRRNQHPRDVPLLSGGAAGDDRARKRGRIINMTGGGAATSFPNGSGYATSKAGLLRFTECVSDTLAGTGVLVFAMDPGLVRTAMTELQLQSEAGRTYLTASANCLKGRRRAAHPRGAPQRRDRRRPVRPARRPHADGGSRRSRPRRGRRRPNRGADLQEPAGQRNAAGAIVRAIEAVSDWDLNGSRAERTHLRRRGAVPMHELDRVECPFSQFLGRARPVLVQFRGGPPPNHYSSRSKPKYIAPFSIEARTVPAANIRRVRATLA